MTNRGELHRGRRAFLKGVLDAHLIPPGRAAGRRGVLTRRACEGGAPNRARKASLKAPAFS